MKREARKAAAGADPQWVTADNITRQMHLSSKALEGKADQMDKGARADPLLLDEAAELIVSAACEGLIDSLLNLKGLVPAAASLMEECSERLKAWRERPTRDVESAPVPPFVNAVAKPSEGEASAEADWTGLQWRHHVIRAKLEDMLQGIARHGDPGERAMAERRQTIVGILAACWEHLSEGFPAALTPAVAAIKTELLPGVDPWLGEARDFRKTAWVLGFLAHYLEQRCDLRVADAAKEHGITRSTIWRACKAGQIVNNGKGGRALLIQRQSFEAWRQVHGPRMAKRNAQKLAAVSTLRQSRCAVCKTVFEAKPKECPNCGENGILIEWPSSKTTSQVDATVRNKRQT